MNRFEFLKRGVSFMGMALIAPSVLAAKDEGGACTVAASETAGPFPTINPANLQNTNIVGTRTGVPFNIAITVKNVNNACAAVPGIIVDIWHCDKDGFYSQYGGTAMQTVDYTGETFLRGRQVTDANGTVNFTSIFPGWYQSRATHIHVHIYDGAGNSLLISQIAFPEGTGSAVETVNAATAYGYTKGMNGYTYNASDNVFSDGTSTEMGTITGSLANGYSLTWDAFITAPVTVGINEVAAETQFQIRQNYPNPCGNFTKVPVVLKTPADVSVKIMSVDGKDIAVQKMGSMSAGEQVVDIDTSALANGKYVYVVKVTSIAGSFSQSRLLVVQR